MILRLVITTLIKGELFFIVGIKGVFSLIILIFITWIVAHWNAGIPYGTVILFLIIVFDIISIGYCIGSFFPKHRKITVSHTPKVTSLSVQSQRQPVSLDIEKVGEDLLAIKPIENISKATQNVSHTSQKSIAYTSKKSKQKTQVVQSAIKKEESDKKPRPGTRKYTLYILLKALEAKYKKGKISRQEYLKLKSQYIQKYEK